MFFKKIGAARTRVFVQKLTVMNAKGEPVLNEANVARLFRQKLKVKDADAVVAQMRRMGKGVGGQVTPEGFYLWASSLGVNMHPTMPQNPHN